MRTHPVLIISMKEDLHATAVYQHLKNKNVNVEWVDFQAMTNTHPLTLSLHDWEEAEIVTSSGTPLLLSDVDTIWWRRPKLPVDEQDLDDETKKFVRGEWEHFIEGLEGFVSSRWVNPPSANRLASRKGIQLPAAKKAGLRTPRTMITNNPDAVRSMVEEDGIPLIYKRIGAAPKPITATKDLLPSDLERLDNLMNCPAIFQERIEARLDIRVTAIGEDLYAAEIDSQAGASPLDWRFDHTVPFRPHQLDEEVSNRLKALMKRLGLVYGAIDLRLTPEGEYIFLEINPNGQYLFVELLAGVPLSEKMAEFLAG